MIDPERDQMTFYRIADGKYVEVTPNADRFSSEAIPGFELDLPAVRRSFQP